MADRDKRDANDKLKAERMLRQAVAIVQGAGVPNVFLMCF
jgi:hypothetical protein